MICVEGAFGIMLRACKPDDGFQFVKEDINGMVESVGEAEVLPSFADNGAN